MAGVKKDRTNSYNKAFPSRLRELMSSRGTSQAKLATALGKSRQSISCYCDGSVAPDWEVVVNIAEFFSVSADYLVGLSSESRRDAEFQRVHAATGLSDAAYQALHEPYHFLSVDVINSILSHRDVFEDACRNLTRLGFSHFLANTTDTAPHPNDPTNRMASMSSLLFGGGVRAANGVHDADAESHMLMGHITLSASEAIDWYKAKYMESFSTIADAVLDDLLETEVSAYQDLYGNRMQISDDEYDYEADIERTINEYFESAQDPADGNA